MKEFMLLVGNVINHQDGWLPEQHQRFLKACDKERKVFSSSKGSWKETVFNESKDVIVGYYNIFTKVVS